MREASDNTELEKKVDESSVSKEGDEPMDEELKAAT